MHAFVVHVRLFVLFVSCDSYFQVHGVLEIFFLTLLGGHMVLKWVWLGTKHFLRQRTVLIVSLGLAKTSSAHYNHFYVDGYSSGDVHRSSDSADSATKPYSCYAASPTGILHRHRLHGGRKKVL